MNETIYMVLAMIAGLMLGILFFGGLWFTVKKAMAAKTPALWILGSFIVRMAITLAGFYYASSGNWKRLLVCVGSFIAARFLVIHFTKPTVEKQTVLRKEAGYEA